MTLCSVCPATGGRTRKAASTPSVRRTTSRAGLIGARRACSSRPPRRVGHPGRRDLAPARRPAAAGARGGVTALPWLLRPGPGLAGPRGEDERLAQRRALEALRQQQRPHPEAGAVLEPGEVDPEHLVRLALVPGRAGPQGGEAGHRLAPGRLGVVGLVDGTEPVEEVEALVAGRA